MSVSSMEEIVEQWDTSIPKDSSLECDLPDASFLHVTDTPRQPSLSTGDETNITEKK